LRGVAPFAAATLTSGAASAQTPAGCAGGRASRHVRNCREYTATHVILVSLLPGPARTGASHTCQSRAQLLSYSLHDSAQRPAFV